MTIALIAGAAALAIVIIVWSAMRIAREAGRDAERAEEAIKGIDHAKRANAIDESVAGLPDDELQRRLRASREQ